jgi:4-carboxymuconolactone decarboxylase
MTTRRLAPVDVAAFDDDTRKLLLQGPGGEPLNIFKVLAHHPKLLKNWLPFGGRLLAGGRLPARDRELLILRTGWLCRAPYEWGQHVAIARATGITDDDIARIARGPSAPEWDEFDAALLRATDELHRDACISDATWTTLAERYDEQQLVEVPFVVGQYFLVSFFLNSAGVQPESELAPLPAGVLGAGARRVDYTILVVDDVDEAVRFYTDVLGLELSHRSGPYAQLLTGQCRLAFYAREAMEQLVPGATVEIGFLVDDVDAAFAATLAGGAVSVVEPGDRAWGQRTAYLRDPQGHLVELAQAR